MATSINKEVCSGLRTNNYAAGDFVPGLYLR